MPLPKSLCKQDRKARTKSIISSGKIKWAVNSLTPLKSFVSDGFRHSNS